MAGLAEGLRRLLLAGLSGMPEDPTVSGMTSHSLAGGAEGSEELVAVLDCPTGGAVFGLNDHGRMGLPLGLTCERGAHRREFRGMRLRSRLVLMISSSFLRDALYAGVF